MSTIADHLTTSLNLRLSPIDILNECVACARFRRVFRNISQSIHHGAFYAHYYARP